MKKALSKLLFLVPLLLTMTTPGSRAQAPPNSAQPPTEPPPKTIQPQPRLVIDEKVFYFKKITDADTVHHTFILRNEGDAQLEIKTLHTTCGCLSVKVEQSVIQPGKETQLYAEFRGANRDGDQLQLINILSNDPVEPKTHLIVRGHVTQTVVLTPERIAFGNVDGTKKQSRKLRIKFQTPNPVAVTDIRVDSDKFIAFIDPVKDDPNAADIRVLSQPPLEIGVHRATLTIDTDAPKNRLIEIPISLNALPPITLLPSKLVLKRNANPTTHYLAVGAGTVAEFAITATRGPTPEIDATIVKIAPDQYRIALKNLAAPPLKTGDELVIETDSDKAPKLTVPVLVIDIPKP
jgi:hypothetical protein